MVLNFPYEISENRLMIDCSSIDVSFFTIEDSEDMMEFVVDKLSQINTIESIIITKGREYEYDYEQVKILNEIGEIFERLTEKLKVDKPVNTVELKNYSSIKSILEKISEITYSIRRDPIYAFKEAKKIEIILKIQGDKTNKEEVKNVIDSLLKNHIDVIISELKKSKIIQEFFDEIDVIKPKDRTPYRKIFRPIIRPAFMDSKFFVLPPRGSVRIEKYKVGKDVEVEIYKVPGKVRLMYYLKAPEFFLTEEENQLLQKARKSIVESKPPESSSSDIEATRDFFFKVSKETIEKIASDSGVYLTENKINELAQILVRYTAGFGLLEFLLADEKITDIYINSPVGLTPIFIQHSDFEECETNLYPSREDAESWATKFRLYSGRPLDEANPVLDTELIVPGGRARVAAITKTLSPEGLGFAFRRHRDKPWTLPLFVKNKMINPIFAGLISFIVDGGRSLLIAGGRGSGKTSLLTAIMLEIMKKYRIVVIEDTLEIPVPYFRKLGYNITRLKARSVITRVESELPAEEALRTALRLGDSVLIIGEIRSKEALALFEAMRIGAMANTVAGTIHGESAYGVFDRVVNDLGVPPTSFKATDLIILNANLKSADGLRRFKRVVEVTEIRKHWSEDPLKENAFAKLLVYDSKMDELQPTDTLIHGESFVINEISKRVRDFYGNWDLVWDNIMLRAKIKQTMVNYAEKYNMPKILEADYTVEANDMFHYFSEEVKNEIGVLDSKEIFRRWDEWFRKRIGKG